MNQPEHCDERAGARTAGSGFAATGQGRPTVLSVCDRPVQAGYLRQMLRAAGFAETSTTSAVEAARQVADRRVDVVVVDLYDTVPGGLTLCQAVRSHGQTVPILAVVDQVSVAATVDYLDAGADDCLSRPFARAELLARIRALVRRSRHPHRASGQTSRPAVLTHDDVWLDPVTHEAGRGSRRLSLSRTEFRLLEAFLRRPRHVLSVEHLLRVVWGDDGLPTRNAVAVYIGYLRRKLETGDGPQLLHTVRGMGYALRSGANAGARTGPAGPAENSGHEVGLVSHR